MDIAVVGRLWPLRYSADPVRLHFDSFRRDNESNKTNPLHFEFAFRQLQVEACLLKLRKDEPDMLSVLLKRTRVDDYVV